MAADPILPTCAVHHDRETRLRCPRCGRAVCDVCLQQVPQAGICPQCHADQVPPEAARTVVRQASAPVTYALLVAYVVVYLLGEATGGAGSQITIAGAQINAAVEAGQWWRVLTATMLHAGITHLLFNGFALYLLGPQLERGVGSIAFAALYVAAGLAGGVAFLIAAPGQVAVGASGAIFGLFGALLAATYRQRHTPAGRAAFGQLAMLLAINLALPLLVPNIAWQAHLGGLLAGTVIAAGWDRLPLTGGGSGGRRVAVALAVLVVAAAIAVLF
jgi:membrane associated rhomboid family serine protease